jgi:hypothetical protein
MTRLRKMMLEELQRRNFAESTTGSANCAFAWNNGEIRGLVAGSGRAI